MDTQPQRTLFSYVRARALRVAIGMGMVCGHVLMGMAIPFITRYAIDDFVGGTLSRPAIVFYACAYTAGTLCSAAFGLWMRKILFSVSHDVEYEILRDVFTHLAGLDYYFYSSQRTGDLMTRMTSDLTSVRECIGLGVLQGTRMSLGFLLSFAVMFAINAPMAMIMLFLLLSTSLIFFLLLRAIRKLYRQSQEQFSGISNFSQESFAGIRTIRGNGMEKRWLDSFEALNREYIEGKMALNRVERPLWPAMGLLCSGSVAMILWMGGRQVVAGTMSIGTFMQFMQYLLILQWPMLALGWTVNLIQRGAISWKRIRAILDTAPRIRDGGMTDHGASVLQGDIVFENVSLELGGVKVLDGINLTIPEGTTLGITGPTGSGKTMLAWMVARMIEPTGGRVLIGARDIRTVPVEVLRRYVGMAPQEAFLFSDTLANNIALGLQETDLEKVFLAAEVAGLTPDVETFPNRYETPLGERGVTLSGGQRQRTAISRAIARNPAVLILDDVFSAIDAQTEEHIHVRLQPVISKRTTIIISHRLSGLRHADRLIVLKNGRIAQQGTHRELMAQPGYYREQDEFQRLQARLETVA